MTDKEKILIAFDVSSPVTEDHDFKEELKTPDWETEESVIRAIRSLGYERDYVGVYNDLGPLATKIRDYQPDIIFNLIEHFNNRSELDRDIAAFFELTGLPYTGCGPTGLTLCKDKGLSKQILSVHRIRIPKFIILPRNKKPKLPKKFPYPAIAKPLSREGSYGISQASFVEDAAQLKERIEFIHQTMESDAIIEEYIEGREIYVSVIGNDRLQVFPFREMTFSQVPEDEPKIATYKAKWDRQYRKRWGIQNRIMKNLPEAVENKIKKVSKKIYRLLRINGYARLDLRLTEQGEVVFIEANPNPILSEWEDFAVSSKHGGTGFQDLIQKIINLSKPNGN